MASLVSKLKTEYVWTWNQNLEEQIRYVCNIKVISSFSSVLLIFNFDTTSSVIQNLIICFIILNRNYQGHQEYIYIT